MKLVIFFILLAVISTLPNAAKLQKFNAPGFTEAAIKAIVDTHNEFRSQMALGNFSVNGTFAPSATNMMKMKWDPEVAAFAQAHANKNSTDHSNRSVVGYGENVYALWGTGQMNNDFYQSLGAGAVRSWFSEYTSLGFKNSVDMRMVHASQVVWAQSSAVGCGISEHFSQGYKQIVICNYKPGGNMRGASVYKEGKTCSECPNGTTCENATGLCSFPAASRNISLGFYYLSLFVSLYAYM